MREQDRMKVEQRKPNMTKPALEERVAALERQVAELREALAIGDQPKDWRRTIGMFSGDEVMKRIDEEGRKWREAQRPKTKRSRAKS
jgi:hypothetical protein